MNCMWKETWTHPRILLTNTLKLTLWVLFLFRMTAKTKDIISFITWKCWCMLAAGWLWWGMAKKYFRINLPINGKAYLFSSLNNVYINIMVIRRSIAKFFLFFSKRTKIIQNLLCLHWTYLGEVLHSCSGCSSVRHDREATKHVSNNVDNYTSILCHPLMIHLKRKP